TTPIKSIVQAITYSRYTKAIIDWGNKFKINKKGEEIKKFPINVSKLFYYPLMSKKEIERITEQDMQTKKAKWAKEFPNNEQLKVILAEDNVLSYILYGYVMQKEEEVIILGIKSDSKIKNLFIGSVANELLVRPTNKALLVIKPTN